jgi:hypothetical protein
MKPCLSPSELVCAEAVTALPIDRHSNASSPSKAVSVYLDAEVGLLLLEK